MNDYDFSTLNDKEFENLTIDLISRDRGKRFERFKAGRDGGIDGRYYGEDEKEEIIQCKHYLKTGYNGLISSLKKKNNGKNEADKVKLLNPDRYIFVTSLPLSASNKKEIKEIFEPYIKLDNDIYGQEDLNDLLKVSHDIEENHYKLWISSTTVLQRIFNNAIKGRSEFKLEEIKEKIKYYVITDNHNNAIKKLEESHTIIIAGEPGIGKTTLAEQIVLNYIEKEFEFCVISNSINEAEAIFEKDKKQIFYFDDFLGSNYLSALESHTDSHIMQFIARIKKDKTKRFILTSRTNIFNQSLLLSDKFRTKKLDSDEFIIKVDDLKEMDKAKILYNHIWHSNLSEEYIDELYIEERYKRIIKHKNFNPRIIEFITDIDRIKSVSAKNYWKDIQSNLNNPSEIWANTFDNQSDEYIRNIVALVVFNGNSILETELEKAYTALNELILAQTYSHNNKDFDSVIKQTVKYFLNRRILSNGDIEYSLFNPSIADFIINRYKNDLDYLINFLKSLKTKKSLNEIYDLYIMYIITKDIYKKIISSLEYTVNDNIDYLVKLVNLPFKGWNEGNLTDEDLLLFGDNMESIVKIIMDKEDNILHEDMYSFFEVINYLAQYSKLKITSKILNKLILAIDSERYNSSDLIREIMYFIEENNILLSSDAFQSSFNMLNQKLMNIFLEDTPNYITDETIKKIEELIFHDIQKQTKNYIKKEFEKIGLFNRYNKLNDFIIDNFDNKRIEEKVGTDIIENCKDRLIYDLFIEEEKKKSSENLLQEAKVAKTHYEEQIDEIDDLFQRL